MRCSLPAFALCALLALVPGWPIAIAAQAPDRSAGTAAGAGTGASAEPPSPADVVHEIERTVVRVQRSLDETRQAGRAEPARCVDATLSQITALLRLAMERAQRTARHERTRRAEEARRERALVAHLLPRARELEREARRCIEPDLDLPSGRTRVTTIIDPDVPTDAIRELRREGLGAIHD